MPPSRLPASQHRRNARCVFLRPCSLEILSLGRNNIKKIEGLDGVADTLRELWISFNSIEKLAGIEKLKSIEILFM